MLMRVWLIVRFHSLSAVHFIREQARHRLVFNWLPRQLGVQSPAIDGLHPVAATASYSIHRRSSQAIRPHLQKTTAKGLTVIFDAFAYRGSNWLFEISS
jgi:hypothetical protein